MSLVLAVLVVVLSLSIALVRSADPRRIDNDLLRMTDVPAGPSDAVCFVALAACVGVLASLGV